jgi:integrase
MSKVSEVHVRGPLAPYVAGFAAELAATGYTPLSAANQLRLMAHVSRWLLARGEAPRSFTTEGVARFLRARRRAGYTCWLSARGMSPLLGYLQRIAVVPSPAAPKLRPTDRLLARYRAHLLNACGLADETAAFRLVVARRFLDATGHRRRPRLRRLNGEAVTRFALREARGKSVGSANLVMTALRSFLRFAHVEGLTRTSLAAAAPTVASCRFATIPRALPPGQFDMLLRGCDRRTAPGRRTYAVLLLLGRLGLRAGDVAGLTLDDIDWRRGEITVRGKGRREDRLPLPADVGSALGSYLRQRRYDTKYRQVFPRTLAPPFP